VANISKIYGRFYNLIVNMAKGWGGGMSLIHSCDLFMKTFRTRGCSNFVPNVNGNTFFFEPTLFSANLYWVLCRVIFGCIILDLVLIDMLS
jgi:hypothetical protein